MKNLKLKVLSCFMIPVLLMGNAWCLPNATINAEEGLAIDETNFPDAEFRDYVKDEFDDGDGILSDAEIENITDIDIQNRTDILSVKGIEYFTKLDWLTLWDSGVTSIDVSSNTELIYLDLEGTDIDSIDITNNKALETIYIARTQISDIDLSNNTELLYFYADDSMLDTINISKNTKLHILNLESLMIKTLDLSANPKLFYINLNYTLLSSLDLTNNSNVTNLNVNKCLFPNKDAIIVSSDDVWNLSGFNYGEQRTLYELVEGDGQEIIEGTEKEVEFTIDGPFDEFNLVILDSKKDSKLIRDVDYTVESGSTIIKLSPEFVKTLPVGVHDIYVDYYNGASIFELTIIEKPVVVPVPTTPEVTTPEVTTPETNAPNTGVSSTNNGLILLVISLSGLGIVAVRKKQLN